MEVEYNKAVKLTKIPSVKVFSKSTVELRGLSSSQNRMSEMKYFKIYQEKGKINVGST